MSLNLGTNIYRGADKSLAWPGRKQARKHVRDDINNVETRAVIKLFFVQGKAPKEIHAILTETLAWFIPGRAKDLSAPLYKPWAWSASGRLIIGHGCSACLQIQYLDTKSWDVPCWTCIGDI